MKAKYHIRTLTLTIKKEWFNMILSGEKKEEYREMKNYWLSRIWYNQLICGTFKQVRFINGYGKDSPRAIFEVLSIQIRKGKKKWGADGRRNYFVIVLGKRID